MALRHGGLRLAEVAPQAGLKYQAAAQAVKRFGQALAGDAERKRFASVLRRKLSTIDSAGKPHFPGNETSICSYLRSGFALE